MFQGSMVALITPMNTDGSIDKKALHDLIEWHIAEKTDALVIAGTTGESATLTTEEHANLINTVVKQVAKRIPVIAGSGSNSTAHTLTLTQQAKEAGADACLIVTPYYNRPTQQGLFEHYKTTAEKVTIPIILYNVPGRTGCDLLPETVKRLAPISNIIGIKDATGRIERFTEMYQQLPHDFAIYSGDDATAMELMLNGAKGDISVTANIAPRKMHDMCQAALNGDRSLAEQLNAELMPLHKQLFIEPNPIPAKWALSHMGKIACGIRLPLTWLDSAHSTEIESAIKASGISLN